MAGSTSAAVPNQGAIALASTVNTTVQQGVAAQTADYFIVFHEAGVMSYDGGIAAVASTQSARNGGPLQVKDSSVVAYRDFLRAQRQGYLQGLAAEINDPAVLAQIANPSFVYDIVFHGIALEGLSAAQAQALRNAPGVKEVNLAPVYDLDTDRVETFVGAGGIWTGTNTPSGVANRGKGGTIAVIDTGLNSAYATHGSFKNDASCGFDAGTPKVVAALDCTSSSTCTGGNPFSSANPHGSHTAATVGGNDHIATGGDLIGKRVSGVAPCAQVFTLKGCSTTTCASTATAAAAQKIIEKQAEYNITAVNYSIGGGTSPWSTSDINRSFLDMVDAGIFVAASAGNTRTESPNPIAAVSHRGAWVTTVANSTHDRVSSNNVDLDMGGPVNQYGLKGGMNFPANDVVATLVEPAAANALGCDPHGAGTLSNKILLVSRGSCSFEIKMNQASAAGAVGVIVTNNTASPFPIVMGATEASTIPGVMVSGPVGAAIKAHLASNPGTKATIRAATSYLTSPTLGDVLADSSLRGPVPTSLEITKPDITAPGTNIFAAYDAGANSYDYMTGTSMSGPHVAGAGALVKNVHPTWTPMEVRSALMMTANRVGSKDFINGTPNSGNWDADDVGSGRLDLTKAAQAGLVMHETKVKFLAANGSVANQRALNMPSMRNVVCTPTCTFTRTVRNTSTTAKTWAATANGGGKLNISISPANFSFTGDVNETQELTITVAPIGAQTAAMAFGHVLLNSTGSPEQHMTVSIKGTGAAGGTPVAAITPAALAITAAQNTSGNAPLNIANTGGGSLSYTISENVAGGCQSPSDIPWLSASPTSGAVVGGANSNITVTATAGTMAVGTYTANVCVATNDTTHAMTGVPVTLTVTTAGGPTFTVTPSVGTPSGTISPNTPQTIASGATTNFTLAPAAGFAIDNVGGTCGGSLAG
ncbi:MAG: S8 family serine peptidase, partial [Dokdonella sp.]